MKRMGKSIRDAEYVDEINMLRWRTALSTESKNRVFAAGSARYTVLYIFSYIKKQTSSGEDVC